MAKGIEKSARIDEEYIGKRFIYPFDGLNVMVEVRAVRKLFGRKEWYVGVADQPSNQVWIYAQEKAKFQ